MVALAPFEIGDRRGAFNAPRSWLVTKRLDPKRKTVRTTTDEIRMDDVLGGGWCSVCDDRRMTKEMIESRPRLEVVF